MEKREMDKNELIGTVKEMIAAPSCCQELKDAGRKWLAAIGTAAEKSAGTALLAEVKEDVCTLDQTIPFFESDAAAQYFGAEQAKSMAAHARELKASGEKWCFCPACAACVKIMENEDLLA